MRKSIKLGLDPVRAIQLATINAAERFGLKGVGALAPGYLANIVVTADLKHFKADAVYHRGKLVARAGKSLFQAAAHKNGLGKSFNVKPFTGADLKFKAKLDSFPVIEVVPGQIITRRTEVKTIRDKNGFVQPGPGARCFEDSRSGTPRGQRQYRQGTGERLRPYTRGAGLFGGSRLAQHRGGGRERRRYTGRYQAYYRKCRAGWWPYPAARCWTNWPCR